MWSSPVAAAYSMDIYAVNISELQQDAINMAEQKLEAIGKELGLPTSQIHTLLGPPAPEVRTLAAELAVDAIVIGSHGHSGWKILLGSTAIKVLHGATLRRAHGIRRRCRQHQCSQARTS